MHSLFQLVIDDDIKMCSGAGRVFLFHFFVVTGGAGAVSSTPSTNIWNEKKEKQMKKPFRGKYIRVFMERIL